MIATAGSASIYDAVFQAMKHMQLGDRRLVPAGLQTVRWYRRDLTRRHWPERRYACRTAPDGTILIRQA